VNVYDDPPTQALRAVSWRDMDDRQRKLTKGLLSVVGEKLLGQALMYALLRRGGAEKWQAYAVVRVVVALSALVDAAAGRTKRRDDAFREAFFPEA
jgi:hypothetical protein